MPKHYNLLPEHLARLDHLSLNDLAEYFEQQADLCRKEAAKAAHTETERQAAGINYLMRSQRIVMRFLRHGCTLDEAIKKTATAISVPAGSVERAWKRFLHDKSSLETQRRNTLIIELAALGLKNADIGKKVGLHPSSISRIISKTRQEFQAGRNANRNHVRLILKSSSGTR